MVQKFNWNKSSKCRFQQNCMCLPLVAYFGDPPLAQILTPLDPPLAPKGLPKGLGHTSTFHQNVFATFSHSTILSYLFLFWIIFGRIIWQLWGPWGGGCYPQWATEFRHIRLKFEIICSSITKFLNKFWKLHEIWLSTFVCKHTKLIPQKTLNMFTPYSLHFKKYGCLA